MCAVFHSMRRCCQALASVGSDWVHPSAPELCSLASFRQGMVFMADLRTKILDFRGFDPSEILILRGGIPRPIGNFPEIMSHAILVGIILVGRLGVASLPAKVLC